MNEALRSDHVNIRIFCAETFGPIWQPSSLSCVCSILVRLSFTMSVPAWGDALSVQRGKAFARAKCSYCHSIDRSSRSPGKDAPPFSNAS
jgi:hypothetical protein